MGRILFAGDITWDQAFRLTHLPAADEKLHASGFAEGLGGVACNAAVAAARAGAGVALLAAIGDDAPAQTARALLAAEGVLSWLAPHPGPTCRVVTLVEPHGEKRLVLYPGVSLYPGPDDVALIDWREIGHLHTAIYGPAGRALVAAARQAGRSWSLDLEPATFAAGIGTLAAEIDGAQAVFVNDRAAAAIGGDAAAVLGGMGAHRVIRTRGAAGASLHETGGNGRATSLAVAPPPGIDIVDTTGAGDCLAGWYLAGTARGQTPFAALEAAVTAATFSCSHPGTQPGFPTLREFEERKGFPQ